jgi:hypothetical protein
MEANKILSADLLDLLFEKQEQGLWCLPTAQDL